MGPMSWLQRIFGGEKDAPQGSGPATSQFHESESTNNGEEGSANAPRREVVQVILRDTMRKHGIPSDWIECRILSTVSRGGRVGMHVSFVVKQAHDRLLNYVFAFQDSFALELARFEPRAKDWLMSVGWQFEGYQAAGGLPDPASWARGAPLAQAGAQSAPGSSTAFAPTADPLDLEPPKSEDDVQRDLEALFAIRDAALADAARKTPDERPDFENTQPFVDSGEPKPR